MADWNAELYVKLYSKLSLALGVTPQKDESSVLELVGGSLPRRQSIVAPASKDNPEFLLAIYNPGQYIPPSMDPIGKSDDRYALSILFNSVPQFSWTYRPAANTVSNVYSSILDYKEAPLTHLDPEQKKKLDEAYATYEKWYAKYAEYRDKYWVALDAYDAAYATFVNGGPPVPRSVTEKLAAAKRDWDGLGHRTAIDSATAVIASFEALEPENFWYRLRERYDAGTQEASLGSRYQVLGFSPPYKSWFGDQGWTEFVFTQKDMDNQRNSDAIGVAGSLDGSYGIFNISGSGSYEKDSSYMKISQTELTFACKLMRVSFDRSWMNPLVFGARAWQWAPGTPAFGSKISSGGDIIGSIAPTGAMTVLPTAAILAKDLVIDGKFQDTVVEELNEKIQANASVGIGPFAISGRFNMEHHQGSEKGSIASSGIRAKDVQIIALVCEVLPESPNPDPSLPWPKH